jgi:UDP-N-acetylmuramyl pentapeptide phosphotransferase/UDP-N-acetylglucosamine-1-phosphate transferase
MSSGAEIIEVPKKEEEEKKTFDLSVLKPKPGMIRVIIFVAIILAILSMSRQKVRSPKMMLSLVAVFLGLTHMYDHVFLIQRKEEKYCDKCGH